MAVLRGGRSDHWWVRSGKPLLKICFFRYRAGYGPPVVLEELDLQRVLSHSGVDDWHRKVEVEVGFLVFGCYWPVLENCCLGGGSVTY